MGNIWAQAERDLVVPNASGVPDQLLWEHTAAVARAAGRLLDLPTVAALRPDPLVLTVAALYHDAALAERLRGVGFVEVDCISRGGNGALRERSAEFAASRLRDLLDPAVMAEVVEVLRETGDRDCRRVEARLIRDADNLHQLGLLTLWPIIRQTAATGMGPADLITRWRTWKQYDYLPARRMTFFFDEVRHLAEARMRVFDRFIDDLSREFEGADLGVAGAPPVADGPSSSARAS